MQDIIDTRYVILNWEFKFFPSEDIFENLRI